MACALALLLPWLTCVISCGPSAGHKETSEQVLTGLGRLTLEQTDMLGPHRTTTEIVHSVSGRRTQEIREAYDLFWDGWDRFRYQVKKGDFLVMDVTLWNGKAYQRDPGGRVRTREDVAEVTYYLRQTWNQWNAVTEPLLSAMVFELEGEEMYEGRDAEKYRIALRPLIEPDPVGSSRLRQSIEHDRIEGTLVLDKASRVPLLIDVTGEYRVMRFSRRPGQAREQDKHLLRLTVRCSSIGSTQVTDSPAVARSP